MPAFLGDIRFTGRLARRHPGFTTLAIVTLAFGIGAVTSIFSLVNGVLLQPLPYVEPDRLVLLSEAFPRMQMAALPFSAPDYELVARSNRSLAGLAAFENRQAELSGIEQPEEVDVVAVTASLFPLLGIRASTGRVFTAEEERQRREVAVISDGLWRRIYGADRNVLGRSLRLNRVNYTIVGVLPASIEFPPRGLPFNNHPAHIFTPRSFSSEELQTYGSHYNASVVARMKPGISIDQVRADLHELVPRLEEDYPSDLKSDPRFALGLVAESLRHAMTGQSRFLLLVLLAAVGMLLLVGCANVANLLLARADARQREFALRVALGADRRQVVRQLMIESLFLGLAGGLVGVLLALWGTDLLVAGLPVSIPRPEAVRVDLTVLVFALGLSVLTALAFGLVPALRVARRGGEALRESSRSATMGRRGARLLAGLVTAQFAVAMMLSIGGGLLIRSFVRILATSPGFHANRLLALDTSLPRSAYPRAQQVRHFYRELVERATRVPGVRLAAGATALPMETTERRMFSLEHPAEAGSRPAAVTALVAVEGDYFQTLRVPFKRGRSFLQSEMASASPAVVIVNETFARQAFGDREPVGERIKWGPRDDVSIPWVTIVGVVRDIKHGRLNEGAAPAAYQPFAQIADEQIEGAFRFMSLVVQEEGVPPTALGRAITRQVHALDASLPVSRLTTMEERVADTVKPERFYTFLMAAFATSALLLAAAGLWGVLSLSVARRTAEIGVRVALGADRWRLVRMVLAQGLLYAVLGLALGLAGSLAFARVLRSFLYELAPTDPSTFIGVSILLAFVALGASVLPALRATRVDPIVALRNE